MILYLEPVKGSEPEPQPEPEPAPEPETPNQEEATEAEPVTQQPQRAEDAPVNADKADEKVKFSQSLTLILFS